MNITDDLETAIDVALDIEDDQFNSTHGSSGYIDHLETVFEITLWIGIISNILIIFAVLMNQRMKSRRNILIMYWAVFDLIGSKLVIGVADDILMQLIVPSRPDMFGVCLLELSTGLFKFNCVILMLLLVSTTVARLQFIKGQAFQWCICIGTVIIYFSSFFLCYCVSPILVGIKFIFVFLVLLAVVLAKEVNICCKARHDDPVSEGTKVKMNIVRIFTYNCVVVVLVTIVVLATIRDYYIEYMMECFIHFTPTYIFIYLCVADVNFRKAFRNCCKKSSADLDATVVYNVDGNKETVDFTRI